jgi:hypothetical protein
VVVVLTVVTVLVLTHDRQHRDLLSVGGSNTIDGRQCANLHATSSHDISSETRPWLLAQQFKLYTGSLEHTVLAKQQSATGRLLLLLKRCRICLQHTAVP